MLVLSAACTSSVNGADERVVHEDGDGPLSVMSGQGVLSIKAPRDGRRWSGSFGAFTLCAHDTDPAIVLQRVRVDTGDAAPSKVRVFLRTVAPADETSVVGVAGSTDPFLSTLGRPPRYADTPGGDRYGGDYTTDLAGTEITQPCDPRPDPVTGYQELVFALTVGPEGGEVRSAWVDYTADGKPFAARVNWRMIACGSAYPASVCRRD